MEEEEIRLDEMIHVLKKRIKLIIIITTIITLSTAIVAFFIVEPKYEVNTTLFVGKDEGSVKDNGTKDYSSNDIQMYQKTLDTFATVISTNTFIKDSLEENDINLSVEYVSSNLTVSAKSNTQILEVSYVDTDPIMASKVLRAISNRFEGYATELISNVNVQIIEEVTVPEEPVSPNKKLYIIVAFIVGTLLGCFIVIGMKYLDRTFDDKKELEATIGLVVLGNIPNLESD